MKIKITKEWLEKRAARDEKAEVSSGGLDVEELKREANSLRQTPYELERLVSAFGKLIHFRRLEMGFSISRLAQSADIGPEEIESIENVIGYQVEPRTVFQLAKTLKLPEKQLMRLSGQLYIGDTIFRNQVERFAARAKCVDQLTDDEHAVLREFVRFLARKD